MSECQNQRENDQQLTATQRFWNARPEISIVQRMANDSIDVVYQSSSRFLRKRQYGHDGHNAGKKNCLSK